MSTPANPFANIEHQRSLDLLEETLSFLKSWPYHPTTQAHIRALDAHLAEPGLEAIRAASKVEAAARKRYTGMTHSLPGKLSCGSSWLI